MGSRVAQNACTDGMMKEAEAAVELHRVKRSCEDNSEWSYGIKSKERLETLCADRSASGGKDALE